MSSVLSARYAEAACGMTDETLHWSAHHVVSLFAKAYWVAGVR
jgi:hypothetical protein